MTRDLPSHDDDRPVGTVLSRRRALALFGSAPLVALFAGAGCDTASGTEGAEQVGACVAKPQLTEGPYYVDENLNRSDLRTDTATGVAREGTPLALTFVVSQIASGACQALANAVVDVWHCDALGNYSDVGSFQGQDFLRGLQITDAGGVARFTTLYPGWYRGRAVHIHFKVRSSASSTQTYEFTSQLFFPDGLSESLFTSTAPYSQKGVQDTLNSRDGIYSQGGQNLLLDVSESGDGYAATFEIALALG